MPLVATLLPAALAVRGAATSSSTCLKLAYRSVRSRVCFGNGLGTRYSDLVETPTGGLSLTVRGNGVLPKAFDGPAADLGKMTVAAAEYVYSKAQPGRWASYLNNLQRYAEAIAFCKSAVGGAELADRAMLLTRWDVALMFSGGSIREGLGLERAAVKLQPDLWTAHNNIQNELIILADEEGAWKAGEDMRAVAGGRPGRAP
jgi:hypothetical protein